MTTAIRPDTQSRFHINLFLFLLLLVSFLSWVTSSAGIWTMLGDFPGQVRILGMNPYKVGMALALSSVIMLSIMAFWFAARSSSVGPVMRMVCLALGLMSSAVSGLLASGAYLMMLDSRTSFEKVELRRQFQTISAPLGEFSAQLRELERDVISFRALSARKQQAEVQSGTSCLVKAKTGEGKRSRMRVRLSRQAQQQSDLMSAAAQDASRLAQLPGSVDNTVLSQVYLQAGLMNNDRRLLELRQWVNGLVYQFQNGFTDEIKGPFVCEDPESVTALRSLAKKLASVRIVLPAFTPTSAPVTFPEAVGNSYEQVSNVLLHTVGLSDQAPDKELVRITALPLLLAFGIEFIIIVLIVVRRALVSPLAPLSVPGRVLSEAAARRVSKVVGVLESLSITERKETYFFVPCDGTGEEMRTLANRLVRRWPFRRSVYSEPVALAQVSAEYQLKLSAAAPDATRYEVWVMSRQVLQWWRTAINDLETTHEAQMQETASDRRQ